MTSKFKSFINSLPLLRTLHKIYVVYSQTQKLERQLEELSHVNALERVVHYDRCALMSKEPGVCTDGQHAKPLTVSLTSYAERIYSVHIAIESLLQQTLKPERIVLWLSEDEFTYEELPEVLKLQEQRGLTLAFTKDIRSYKKLIPALKVFPDSLIITVDDDFIYPTNHLERLFKAWQKEPCLIHCYRAHRMQYNDRGHVLSYKDWQFEIHGSEASADTFPTSGAGVLYFPGCFDDEVLNEDVFMSLCPTADDIWLKLMAQKRGTLCKVLAEPPEYARIETIAGMGGPCLWHENVNANDAQIQAVMSRYSEVEF